MKFSLSRITLSSLEKASLRKFEDANYPGGRQVFFCFPPGTKVTVVLYLGKDQKPILVQTFCGFLVAFLREHFSALYGYESCPDWRR